MKCIENLFDEILEEIFKKLPLQSRLICKEVCPRWLEILMTRAVFREDRHIYLTNFHPYWTTNGIDPYSTFLNSKFPYEILTICDRFPFRYLSEEQNLFWSHIGRSVKKVHCKINSSLGELNIFYAMPLVEELSFENELEGFSWIVKGLLRVNAKREPFLPNLRKVEFLCNYADNWEIHDTAAELRKIFPNNLQIHFKACLFSKNNNDDCDFIVGNFAPKEFVVYIEEDSDIAYQKVFSFEKLAEKKIWFMFYDHHIDEYTELNFLYVDSFLEKHTNIKNFGITSKFVPFTKPYAQITQLVLTDDGQVRLTSLKVFELFENLENLDITFNQREEQLCVVGHENINLPKLKYLTLLWFKIECADCAKSIATSFPSVVEFRGTFYIPNSASILALMFRNCPKLKTMDFKCDNLGNLEKSLIDLEERPNLEVLKIESNERTEEDFEILSKFFPNLHNLALHFKEVKSVLAILGAVLQGLPKLRSLHIEPEYSEHTQYDNYEKSQAVKILENYGQLLRNLRLPFSITEKNVLKTVKK